MRERRNSKLIYQKMCHISHIGQIFDYNWCLCKQRFKLKVDDCTQLNLSSKITVYLEFCLTEGKKIFHLRKFILTKIFSLGSLRKFIRAKLKSFVNSSPRRVCIHESFYTQKPKRFMFYRFYIRNCHVNQRKIIQNRSSAQNPITWNAIKKSGQNFHSCKTIKG